MRLFSLQGVSALIWLLCVATGSAVQLQHALIGYVLAPLAAIKILFAISLVVIPVANGSIKRKYSGAIDILSVWLICCILLTLSFSINFFLTNSSQKNLIVSFFASYLFLFTFPFYSQLNTTFIQVARNFFVVGFLPICLLGLFQWSLNDPILSVGGEGFGFEVVSWEFYGQVRAFSIFLSGLDYGYFLAFSGSLFLYAALKGRRRLISTALFFLSAISVASTNTRLAMIIYAFSVLTTIAIHLNWRFFLHACPYLYFALGGVLVFGAPLVLSLLDIGTLSEDHSIYERFYYWNSAITLMLEHGVIGVLFGTGISQGASNPGFIVDNVYLNYSLQSGLVALLAFLCFILLTWHNLVRTVSKKCATLDAAGLAFYSTVLIGFLVNTNQFAYLLLMAPLMASFFDSFATTKQEKYESR